MLTDKERWAVANNFYTTIMNDMGTGTCRVMIMDYLKRIEEEAVREDRAQTVETLEAQKGSLPSVGQHILDGVKAGLYIAQSILRGEN